MKKTKQLTLRSETIRQLTGLQIRSVHGGMPIQQTGFTVCVACHPSDTVPSHCNTCYTCPDDTEQATTCTVSTSG